MHSCTARVRQAFQHSIPLLHVDRLEMLSLCRAFLPRMLAHRFYKSPPRPIVPRTQLTVCLDVRSFVLSAVCLSLLAFVDFNCMQQIFTIAADIEALRSVKLVLRQQTSIHGKAFAIIFLHHMYSAHSISSTYYEFVALAPTAQR